MKAVTLVLLNQKAPASKDPMHQHLRFSSLLVTGLVALTVSAAAADWTNSGGNAGRNELSTEVGPSAATVLWSGSRPSLIAWQPVTEGNRVFIVRQTAFPPSGQPTEAPVVCQDLTTGAELWHFDVPFNANDWTTWIAGASQGHVYAARSGNGASVSDKLYCLDSATGAQLWMSVVSIDAGAYDGVVFAPNGDPIIGSFTHIWRIDHTTGATVWTANRQASISGDCGVAATSTAAYAADILGPGLVIKKFDLATGALLYTSPAMSGASTQNTPMVGPDGTIYQHVQQSQTVNLYYAWTDTGTSLVQKWNVPSGYTAFAEFGVGPDGSVYHLAPNSEIHRLNPATGATLNTTGPIPTDPGLPVFPRLAVDAQGRVYLNNAQGNAGILASYNADLSLRWSIPFSSGNIGGPILAQNGTLLMAGIGTNVIAFRDSTVTNYFCFGDGSGPVACPCTNFGAVGHGCANSVNPAGGQIQGSGASSVSSDSVVLTGSGMPNSSVLYFQGTTQVAGGSGSVFGDGLRCAGGTIVRIGTKQNVAGSSQYPGPGDQPLSVRGQVPPTGGVRTYQAWYRNAAPYCTSSTFNLTNGLQITWVP